MSSPLTDAHFCTSCLLRLASCCRTYCFAIRHPEPSAPRRLWPPCSNAKVRDRLRCSFGSRICPQVLCLPITRSPNHPLPKMREFFVMPGPGKTLKLKVLICPRLLGEKERKCTPLGKSKIKQPQKRPAKVYGPPIANRTTCPQSYKTTTQI